MEDITATPKCISKYHRTSLQFGERYAEVNHMRENGYKPENRKEKNMNQKLYQNSPCTTASEPKSNMVPEQLLRDKAEEIVQRLSTIDNSTELIYGKLFSMRPITEGCENETVNAMADKLDRALMLLRRIEDTVGQIHERL
jgi:hypothetical protein